MLLMIVAAVAAIQDAEPRRVFQPATDQTFVQARQALDETLLDYTSARFRNVTAHELVVCGKVNSKNRMGAYVGWTDFAVSLAGDSPTARTGGDDIIVQALCNERNRPRSADFSDRLTHQSGRP